MRTSRNVLNARTRSLFAHDFLELQVTWVFTKQDVSRLELNHPPIPIGGIPNFGELVYSLYLNNPPTPVGGIWLNEAECLME